MIRVEISRDGVLLEGHAGSGAYGHDLVCAATSILWYTLTEKLRKDKMRCEYVEESGHCCLKLLDVNKHTDEVIDMFSVGMELLECNFPNNIFLKKV